MKVYVVIVLTKTYQEVFNIYTSAEKAIHEAWKFNINLDFNAFGCPGAVVVERDLIE